MAKTLIQAHGGKLIDRYLTGSKCEFVGSAARSLPQLSLSARNLADLECIATGVYSPLVGFVDELEYKSIVEDLHLPNGLAWSIPVTLQVPATEADKYPLDRDIALVHPNGDIVAVMSITSKYQPNQQREAEAVYQTTDPTHPGIQAMLAEGDVYLGGPIVMVNSIDRVEFLDFRLTPQMTRQIFVELQWQTIAELQITPLKFEHAFYCTRSQSMATAKTSPSSEKERIHLSGTKVRELLRGGQTPPPEFSRPEVAQILITPMRESTASV